MADIQVAPPGWEDQIKELQSNGAISNIYALAWHVKQQQVSHTRIGHRAPAMEATQYGTPAGLLLVDLIMEAKGNLAATGESISQACYDAASGNNAAINNILNAGQGITIHQEQPW